MPTLLLCDKEKFVLFIFAPPLIRKLDKMLKFDKNACHWPEFAIFQTSRFHRNKIKYFFLFLSTKQTCPYRHLLSIMKKWADLPLEVRVNIFSHLLKCKNLRQCILTCKSWQKPGQKRQHVNIRLKKQQTSLFAPYHHLLISLGP